MLYIVLFILLLALAELLYLAWLWKREIGQLTKDWHEAHSYSSAKEFIEKNKQWLSQVRFGFNVSPEHLEWVFRDEKQLAPGVVIETIVKDWGLRTGRLAIRMNNSLDLEHGQDVSLVYYQPWLDELAKQQAQLYLNAGIKAARWPEIHVPEELLHRLYGTNIPGKGYEITPDDPLGKFTLQTYYPQFFSALQKLSQNKKYPSNFFFAVQPENEPLSFFGPKRWKLSKTYVIEAIKVAHAYFPTARIMQNSPISWGLFKSTNQVLREVKKQLPELKGKLLSGVNNYYKQPHVGSLSMRVAGESLLENLAFASVTKQLSGDVVKECKHLQNEDIGVMVSELQAEPWDPYFSPGNDFQEFLFILLRNKRVMTLTSAVKTDVLIWGIEELLHNVRNSAHPRRWHHQEILKLVSGVNKLGAT